MSIQRYGTPTKPGALPFSKAAGADGWLFVSGQVPRDADGEIVTGNITVQARVTLDNLKKVLESAGYSLNDVVRVTVYLDDTRDFAGFNKVYAQYFSAEHAAARVCVQARMMSDLRVEVDCIGYKKDRWKRLGGEGEPFWRMVPPPLPNLPARLAPPRPFPRLSTGGEAARRESLRLKAAGNLAEKRREENSSLPPSELKNKKQQRGTPGVHRTARFR